MKTLLNNKTLTIALLMIFSLHGMISQKPLFGLVAQTSDVFLNSEWFLVESEVNGISVSLENSGLPIFRSPHNENFFLHYYGVSCLGSFKVTYTDVIEDSFSLDTIIEYDSCNYTDPE